ncbi:MAG: endonuclease III [Chlamydiales bacterium]
MLKKERAAIVQAYLNKYFPHPPIPLSHTDSYTLLIAVVLSARSTDAKVNQITPKLFAKAATPQKMAKLSVEEIREIIKPCGLSPQKARAIKELSALLVERHSGKVPASFKELEALPGVGHKTASVVLAQAYNIPTFPVDTHIFRCARRWGLSRGKNVASVEKDLKRVFPEKEWIRLHIQIIYYGRRFCPARGHKKEECPICSALG